MGNTKDRDGRCRRRGEYGGKGRSPVFLSLILLGIAMAVVDAAAQAPKTDAALLRARLGLSVQTVTEQLADALELKAHKGALVTAVLEDGPGAEAGLKRGDVILRLDDGGIRDAEELAAGIAGARPGKEVDLTVLSGTKTMEVTVRIGKRQEDAGGWGREGDEEDGMGLGLGPKERIGLKVAEPDRELRRRYALGPGPGLVVLGVEDGGRAGQAGIQVGDFVLEAGRREVVSARELKTAVAKARKKGALVLTVKRGEDVFFVVVKVGGKNGA